MVKKNYIILFLFWVFLSCINTPQFVIDNTYFHENKIQRPAGNALENIDAQSVSNITGIYGSHFYAVQEYPAILSLAEKGRLNFVLLADSLDISPGEFVAATGAVIDSMLFVGRRLMKSVPLFQAEHVHVVFQTKQFFTNADNDYRELYSRLSTEDRKPESRLRLPQSPEWRMLVDEERNNVIVYFSVSDLMYAAEVNFVYDLYKSTLKKVYFNEWFKGE